MNLSYNLYILTKRNWLKKLNFLLLFALIISCSRNDTPSLKKPYKKLSTCMHSC